VTDDQIPERDPLADLVSRSVGQRVPSVDVEVLPSPDGERKRLRFVTASGASSAIFDRAPRGQTTEAQLLPFLARKTDRVPAVHSRGIPPPHVALGPWVLIEDVDAGSPACDGDPREIVRAKLAIERAVAKDLPALKALGLRELTDLAEPLASAPRVLLHGDLVCANAVRVARGVVLLTWRRAALGPGVLDVARLAQDLERAGRAADAKAVREVYASESGLPNAVELMVRAGQTVAAAKVVEESPDSTGHRSG
jgi:hypothetical protein